MSMRTFTLLALLLLVHATTASAQAVKLEFVNGRVNLSTQNAPIRAILAEWTRLGGTKIVNGERVTGTPLTIELQGVTERQALDVVLRNVAGYMIAAREVAGTGVSHFDRVMILPTSTAPRTVASTPTFSAPVPRQIAIEDDVDDIDAETEQAERQEVDALRRAQEIARQRALEQANRLSGQQLNGEPAVGQPPTVRQATPFIPLPQPQLQQGPQPVPTVQAPGQVVRPSNPFTALPGSSRPGEVTPVPSQDRQPPPQNEQ
jgi:hypothetical protein